MYIKDEKKLFNMFILCAITMALNSLNIYYSIGLFGDEKFKVILKQFEEKHSLSVLQKVYECLMLKRWRSSLPSVLDFAIKSKLFNKKKDPIKERFYEEYPERIIYLITDGLDENLFLVQEWKKKFTENHNIGFGFIFNIPNKVVDILNEKNEKFSLNENKNNNEKENNYIENFFSDDFSLDIKNNKKDKININEKEEYDNNNKEEEEDEDIPSGKNLEIKRYQILKLFV